MSKKQTPMMEQYLDIKSRYSEELLFFRLGDFYELFNEDALVASRELNITLTGRPTGDEGRNDYELRGHGIAPLSEGRQQETESRGRRWPTARRSPAWSGTPRRRRSRRPRRSWTSPRPTQPRPSPSS